MRVDVVLRGMDHATMAECAAAADTVPETPLTLWLPESPGDRNPFATAAGLLARTRTVRIGTGVLPVPLRSTVDMLAGALTLQEAFPGRFDLGVGSGNAGTLDRAGVPAGPAPLAVARGFLDAVDGLRERSGLAALLDFPRTVPPPPVYLAAHNRRMIELAVSRADGVILNMVPRCDLPAVLEHVRAAAARAGTTPRIGMFQLAAFGPPSVATRAARRVLSGFLRSPVVRRRLASFGSPHLAAAQRMAALPPVADDDTLAAVLPDEVVHDFGVTTPDALRERLDDARDRGLAFVALSVFPAPLRLRKPFPPVPENDAARGATLDLIANLGAARVSAALAARGAR
jgi:alkanesulfonate monooxygenase SsuD/methylene tetrahydromethanopterin reductase-like flavin-dependent oxidoreductase (luciferase family)